MAGNSKGCGKLLEASADSRNQNKCIKRFSKTEKIFMNADQEDCTIITSSTHCKANLS